MLKSIFATTFVTICLQTFAQNPDLKEKKVSFNNDAELIYNVSRDNVKNGPFYVRKKNNNQLWFKGFYEDDKRAKSWYFYNDAGKLETSYSYDHKKLIFLDSAVLKNIEVKIVNQDKDAATNASIPVLLCSMDIYLYELTKDVIIPAEHFGNESKLAVKVKSLINKNGEATYSINYMHNGKTYTQKLKLNERIFKTEWIPAIYQNKPVESEFTVNTILSNTTIATENHRRFKWNY